MEKQSNIDFKAIMDVLAAPHEVVQRSAYLQLYEARQRPHFISDVVSALKEHSKKSDVLRVLIDILRQTKPFPELWQALVQLCEPWRLAKLAPMVGEMSELLGVDATGEFTSAVHAMAPADQVLAVFHLGDVEGMPDDWYQWLFTLASGMSKKADAFAILACNAGDHLAAVQWSTVVQTVIGARPVNPQCVLKLATGLRSTRAVFCAQGVQSILSPADWQSFIRFLVVKSQGEAINVLLDCRPGDGVPRWLIEIILGGLRLGWPYRKVNRLGDAVDKWFDLRAWVDAPGFARRIAMALATTGLPDYLQEVIVAIKECADFPGDELVSMVLALSELKVPLSHRIRRMLFKRVEPLDGLLRARAAIGLLRLAACSRHLTTDQFAQVMNWLGLLGADSVDLELEAWTCVLQFGEEPPTPKTWTSALACAKTARHGVDPFVVAVLKLLNHDEPLWRPSDEVVAEVLQLSLVEGGVGDIIKHLPPPDKMSASLRKIVDPGASRLLASCDADSVVSFLVWLALAQPERWTEQETDFRPRVVGAGGALTFVRLVAQLHRKRCAADPVWSTLVAWAQLMPEPFKVLAQTAVALVLFFPTPRRPEPWCSVHLPPEWDCSHLPGMLKVGPARMWLNCVVHIEEAPLQLRLMWTPVFMESFKTGKLRFTDIGPVKSAQNQLRKQYGSIDWDCVFFTAPDAHQRFDYVHLCTVPALGDAFRAWLEALGALVYQMLGSKDVDQSKLRTHLLPLLAAMQGELAQPQPDAILPATLERVFGSKGAPAAVSAHWLRGLLQQTPDKPLAQQVLRPMGWQGPVQPAPDKPQWEFYRQLEGHVAAVLALAPPTGHAGALGAAFGHAHAELMALINTHEFASQMDEFHFLTVEVLDKSDVWSILRLNFKTEWALQMLTLMAGPYVGIVIRDDHNAMVATCWCALVVLEDEDSLSLVCNQFEWAADWRPDERTYPPEPIFHLLGSAVTKVLRSVAAVVKVERVLTDKTFPFTPPDWPVSSRKFRLLARGSIWWPVVSLPNGAPASDQMAEHVVAEMPPAQASQPDKPG